MFQTSLVLNNHKSFEHISVIREYNLVSLIKLICLIPLVAFLQWLNNTSIVWISHVFLIVTKLFLFNYLNSDPSTVTGIFKYKRRQILHQIIEVNMSNVTQFKVQCFSVPKEEFQGNLFLTLYQYQQTLPQLFEVLPTYYNKLSLFTMLKRY